MKTMRLPKISAWVYRWESDLKYGGKSEKEKTELRKKIARSVASTLNAVEWRLAEKRRNEARQRLSSVIDQKWWRDYGGLQSLEKICHEYLELAQAH